MSERLNAAFTAQTIEEIPAQNPATVEYMKFGFGLAPQVQKKVINKIVLPRRQKIRKVPKTTTPYKCSPPRKLSPVQTQEADYEDEAWFDYKYNSKIGPTFQKPVFTGLDTQSSCDSPAQKGRGLGTNSNKVDRTCRKRVAIRGNTAENWSPECTESPHRLELGGTLRMAEEE